MAPSGKGDKWFGMLNVALSLAFRYLPGTWSLKIVIAHSTESVCMYHTY